MTSKALAELVKRIAGAAHAYEVLSVPKGADLTTIKLQHRALAQGLHPDRTTEPGAADAMARVNVAWDELRDPKARKRLDTLLHVSAAACAMCKGKGTVERQKGFKAKVSVPCPACNGLGE